MSQPSATRSRENTRARLVDAASEVFAESGLEGASVEAICERAGFTRGAFYSNFGSKEELLLALMRRIAEEKLARVVRRVSELGPEQDRPRDPAAVVSQVLDVEHDERATTVLMSEIRTNAMRDPQLAAAYLAWEAAMVHSVTGIILDIAEAYSLVLRMPAEDAGRLIIDSWDANCIHAAIAELTPEQTARFVTERTALLATVIADPAAR
ncbi:TetR/AcrR family transcriptional regulator [Microbacterium sp. 18062]|uniref:TetR/AcrR family transcriptional regulator n=1 Tax=Microbacterium sp. 18062 TaxID=2681410 RepID=UPI00135BB6A2|nr:TetR/AcrR family transcriptional regulator [Microbacterium sp. 18062]